MIIIAGSDSGVTFQMNSCLRVRRWDPVAVKERKSIHQEEGEIPAETVSGDDLASRRLY